MPLTIDRLIDDLLVYREALGGECPVALSLTDEGDRACHAGDLMPGFTQPIAAQDSCATGFIVGDDDADYHPLAVRCVVLWPEVVT